MTRYFVTPTRYICDRCFATELGESDKLPDGWSEVVTEEKLEHRCERDACATDRADIDSRHGESGE